jgi:hypothetical protein
MKSGVLFSTKLKINAVAFFLTIGLSFLSSAPLFSQGSAGRILGTVTDQSGGAIAGASVSINDTERGTSRNLTTDDSGEYNAPSLTPSTYKVHVEAKGFKALDRQNVILEVNGNVRVDIQLQPGDVSQTITVTEEVPLIETTNAELGGTIQNQIIENLPLNGRNFENLLTLRPGVEIYVGGGGWTQSTNGVRPHDNVYIVEGVNSSDPYMAQSIMNAAMAAGDAGTILPVDAIDEFKTQINPPAEYGWKPGAVVSVGIKSGTNSFHGTGYAYGRSDSFDARNYFNPAPAIKAPLNLEQFGATVGGPIKKDKLFFFANFEEQRYSVGNPASHKLPFTQATGDPANSLIDACNATRLAGTVSALSEELAGLDATCTPIASKIVDGFQGLFPVVNAGSPNTVPSDINSANEINSGLVKGDYHINDKNTLTGMYFISPGNGILADDPGHQLDPLWLTNQYARSQVGSGAWTWTPTSTWVNEARVGYSHYYQTFVSQDHTLDPATYTFHGQSYPIFTGQINPAYFGLPRLRINTFKGWQAGASWPKTVGPDSVTQFADHVSYLRGKHAFKFGGEILLEKSTNNVTANTKGPVQFASLEDFFNGNAQSSNTGFLTGNLLRHMTYNGYAAFLQDDWRIKPTVTVNLGIRYEITTVMKEANNLIGNFDPVKGLQQVGIGGVTAPFNGDHNNFSPRVGIAWDVQGNGKTVVRAGGSIIYEQISLDAFNGQGNFLGLKMIPTGAELFSQGLAGVVPNPPCDAAHGCVQGVGTINNVATKGLASTPPPNNWTNNSSSNPLYSQTAACGTGIGGDPSLCNILGVNRNLRTPYVSTWTLGIQRAITNNMSVEVAYVGNHGTKLLGLTDLNQPAVASCTPTDANCERQNQPYTKSCPTTNGIGLGIGSNPCFPYLGYIDFFSNINESNYNGLQMSLTQRTSHGLSFTAGYTYAHALDENGDNEGNGLHVPIDSSNPRSLYANSDFDIRHRFTFSVDYAIPGRKGFGQLLEGWAINSIVTVETGAVWGVNDQTNDFSGTGESGNPLGSIGEQWVFSGKPSDFTPVHGWTDTNCDTSGQNCTGGVPYHAPGDSFFTGTDPCSIKATAIGAMGNLNSAGCFAVGNSVLVPQANGTLGTNNRNIFRDQGFKNLDMSVTKAFKFKERVSAEFKAEIFNVFNHPTFANPYGGPGGGTVDPSGGAGFGFAGATPDVLSSNSVLGSGGARAIQLGAKFTF